MASAIPEPVLEVSGIRKRFGAVTVLDGVQLTIRPGEIHALMGENGAGKSTLMKILAGVYQPDTGEIRFKGEPVDIANLAVFLSSPQADLISGQDVHCDGGW